MVLFSLKVEKWEASRITAKIDRQGIAFNFVRRCFPFLRCIIFPRELSKLAHGMNLINDGDLGSHSTENATLAHFMDQELISDHVKPTTIKFCCFHPQFLQSNQFFVIDSFKSSKSDCW